jgi:hypothetical protein
MEDGTIKTVNAEPEEKTAVTAPKAKATKKKKEAMSA